MKIKIVTHKALCTGKKSICLNGLFCVWWCVIMRIMYDISFTATGLASKILTLLKANYLKYQVPAKLLDQVMTKGFQVENLNPALVARLASGLFNCWSSLRNNNTALNLQTFTSTYGSRRFTACDQGSHYGFFHPHLPFFSRPGCLDLIVKNPVKSGFFDVKNSSATSMCSIILRKLYITVFGCAHQMRRYAYRMK